eukprot:2961748-Rhodomonas_salina.2
MHCAAVSAQFVLGRPRPGFDFAQCCSTTCRVLLWSRGCSPGHVMCTTCRVSRGFYATCSVHHVIRNTT